MVGEWAQRVAGEWYEAVTCTEPLALWSPGGGTPFEAAEKWAPCRSQGSLGPKIFLRVQHPASQGPATMFVKAKRRMVYDCEYVDISKWKFSE